MHFYFHPNSDNINSRVQRRADKHEQSDSRGQYPHPRDNRFAQPKPRIFPQPQLHQPPAPSPSQEEEPPQDVFTENGAQYVKPARPHVPDYMKTQQQTPLEPEAFDMPVQQADYIAKQNPYVVMSEKNTDPVPKVRKRTLLFLAIAAVVILAGVWISQLIFTAQTQLVYVQHEAAEAVIANKHPFGYQDLIEREAYKNNLDPAFVAAIVLNESSFDPYAESYRGARGLMQMMEDTALWVYESIGMGADYSFDLMYDAEANVTYGCWYLSYLSGKFGGDPVLVAAAFHSGQTNVMNWLNNEQYSSDQQTIALSDLPEGNTKAYVERVLGAFAAYRRLYYEEVSV